MSVRKRNWKTDRGESREAWVVDYSDQDGKRRHKTFPRKRDADAWHAQVAVDIGLGIHTPDSCSITVTEAGRLWLASRDAAGVERTTLASYREHLTLHIVPLIGGTKLAMLTAPLVRAFEDRLRQDRSPAMVRKLLVTLSSILADAQDRGLVAQNVARNRRARNTGDARQKHRLEIGVTIPTLSEMRAIIGQLGSGRERPLLLTAIFTGLRASELRGLRWADVDLPRSELHVRQRADRFATIGALKSAGSPGAAFRCCRWWRTRCANGASPAREMKPISSSRMIATSRSPSQPSFGRSGIRRSVAPASSRRTAAPSIRGCTRCAISMRRGASTAAPMAASNCRSKSCKAGSGTPRSR